MGWALCGGVVACATAYPSTFLGWALCNGSVACTIAWLRTFGVGVVRQFDCLRYRLAAHVLGLGVCDGTVACAIAWPLTFCAERRATTRLPAPLSWPHTFEPGRCATIRLPAPLPWPRTFGAGRCATIRLFALPLTRARFWAERGVRRFGCLRHYLGRVRSGLCVVPRFSCPRGYVAVYA